MDDGALDVSDAFACMLGGLLSTSARCLELNLSANNGATLNRFDGDLRVSSTDAHFATVRVADILCGGNLDVGFALNLPAVAGPLPSAVCYLTAELTYVSAAANRRERVAENFFFRRENSASGAPLPNVGMAASEPPPCANPIIAEYRLITKIKEALRIVSEMMSPAAGGDPKCAESSDLLTALIREVEASASPRKDAFAADLKRVQEGLASKEAFAQTGKALLEQTLQSYRSQRATSSQSAFANSGQREMAASGGDSLATLGAGLARRRQR